MSNEEQVNSQQGPSSDRPPFNKERGRWGCLIACIAVTVCCSGAWRWLGVTSSYHIFYLNDPEAEVLIDGKRVEFEEGIYKLYPWNQTYLVEIRSKRLGVIRRTIYPHAEGSDSGVVMIEKDSIEFTLECWPQPSHIVPKDQKIAPKESPLGP